MTTIPAPLKAAPPRARTPAWAWVVALATAAAYAAVGGLGLVLAGPPGYASPLYPAAGVALAATLTFGRAALPGVLLGSFVVNAALGLLRGQAGLALVALPLAIGVGAALQAGVGAALIRRFVGLPLLLNAPRDIVLAGALGGLAACTVSASVAVPALLMSSTVGVDTALATWLTWWAGDTLGVLIGAPLALTLVGRPREDWRPRQRTVGVPMLVALALLAAAMIELDRLDRQRLMATFERGADRLYTEAQARLSVPLYALQALHSAARAHGELDDSTLREAARWWLEQPISLQAMGYSARVALDALPAYEVQAHAEAQALGLAGYRVFDRDSGAARATDGEVVALRHVKPLAGNAAALGVNALSIPEARAAVLATRRSGQPAATAGFRLTQSAAEETGLVVYQALYRGDPDNEAARIASFSGVVFVSLRTEAALAGLAPADQTYLRWCLVDPTAAAPHHRLAGDAPCDAVDPVAGTDSVFATRRTLPLGDRQYELRVTAAVASVPGQQRETAWLLSLAGLGSAAMLGALLLTVTGHSRRTERAVQAATAELRHEAAERGQAERALRESEQRLRSIFDHAPVGLMFLDPGGRVIDCNPRLCQMIGGSADDLRGRAVLEMVHPDDVAAVVRLRRDLFAGIPDTAVEPVRLRRADDRELLVRVTAAALRNERGRVVRAVGVLEDITEHLQLQASQDALHRAEAANRAKSDFLSRMSHELRTPLNAMIGFAQLLGMDHEPGLAPHQNEWAQQIQRAGWHLLELINDTLDLARVEAGAVPLTLEPLSLAPLVSACQAMVESPAAERGITLHAPLVTETPAVLGDATRVKQILTNLLSNAVKYNRPGGQVTIGSRPTAGGMVEVAVTDTGLGMTEDQLAALFQPYNRVGRENSGIEGTGIGLVISRRLAELMGGTLEAASRADAGSTFTLRLPAAAAAEAPPADPAAALHARYRQRLVYYVEDNETNVEVMRGVLALREQIVLETSALGLDGVAGIRRRRPDLILLDMHLPDISGPELLRHLKRDDLLADIPVIVVSADATPQHMEQALTLGAAHYVTKPLDVARFLKLVDGVLESADTRWGM